MASNGRLDVTTLKPLPGFNPYPDGSNFLAPSTGTHSNLVTPAVHIDATNMQAAFRTRFGVDLTYAEAYRSYTMQQQRWAEYQNGGPRAADPGTSNHGWAKAIDWRCNVGVPGSDANNWFWANAKDWGFTPIAAKGAASEAWHWEHLSDTNVTKPVTVTATASSGTTTRIYPKGPDMPSYVVTNGTSRPAGKIGTIPKGSTFVIDHAAATIRWVKSSTEQGIIEDTQLKPFGLTWKQVGPQRPADFVNSLGFKRIGW